MLTEENCRKLAVEYLKMWVGTPYLWGGDDPIKGFDCSGLVHEWLQAVGLETHGADSTAHELYIQYSDKEITRKDAKGGDLVFWFNAEDRAIHVETMVDEDHVIGASGGGSKVKTIADAAKYNAFVKIRPITYRGFKFKIVNPF